MTWSHCTVLPSVSLQFQRYSSGTSTNYVRGLSHTSRYIYNVGIEQNNDLNYETLSGCGTTHNTNGIMIQRHHEQTAYTWQPCTCASVKGGSLDVTPTHFQTNYGSLGMHKDFGPACIGQDVDVYMHGAAKMLRYKTNLTMHIIVLEVCD